MDWINNLVPNGKQIINLEKIENYLFSILQLTSKDMQPENILTLWTK